MHCGIWRLLSDAVRPYKDTLRHSTRNRFSKALTERPCLTVMSHILVLTLFGATAALLLGDVRNVVTVEDPFTHKYTPCGLQ